MRAAKIGALRSAVMSAIAIPGTTASQSQPPLPIPPLIDIIVEYAIEDFTVTRLIGTTGEFGNIDNCSGSEALLHWPRTIAVIPSTDASTAASDEIMIADSGNFQARLYSIRAGAYAFPLYTALPLRVCKFVVCRSYSKYFW
jgi:hypothetical protein